MLISHSFSSVKNGMVAGSVTAAQLPNVPAVYINIKAVNTNVGNVYIGNSSVTKVGTSTNTTTGFELDAGQETGWIPVDNLNRFYLIADNSNDEVCYIVLQ